MRDLVVEPRTDEQLLAAGIGRERSASWRATIVGLSALELVALDRLDQSRRDVIGQHVDELRVIGAWHENSGVIVLNP